jgi:hypothetical protein
MGRLDTAGRSTTSNLNSTITNFSVTPKEVDGVENNKENHYDNEDFQENFAYYDEIPEYKTSINAYATWVLGKGWTTQDTRNKLILENINGMGEDTFTSILWNMIVIKKFHGDAYAEIIRGDDGIIQNLKPLNPARMRTIINKQGIITEYEQFGKSKTKKFQPFEIFHIMNDRVADSIHGTSITQGIKWIIDARREAMEDWKRISHRSTIRVMYVDQDKPEKLTLLKGQYKDAIENGEVMILPSKKGETGFEDLNLPPVEAFLQWIRYLEDVFYKAVGVPKIVLGGSALPEGDSKVSFLSFEPVYVREIEGLKMDIWNQLAIRVEFSAPVSLKDKVQENEVKNSSQIGFQQNDAQAGVGE